MAIHYIKADTFLGQFTLSSSVVTIEDTTSPISLAKSLAFYLDLCFLSFAVSFFFGVAIIARSTFFCLPIGLGRTIPFLFLWFLEFAMKLKASTIIVGMDLQTK